ncbi:hypothetical protein B0H14DRAFT_2639640 [Mycena olivaceomarginata]|nr:hypothetical protein B0H14DRAFT_2639640 [Mycena olivaceomarginata]
MAPRASSKMILDSISTLATQDLIPSDDEMDITLVGSTGDKEEYHNPDWHAFKTDSHDETVVPRRTLTRMTMRRNQTMTIPDRTPMMIPSFSQPKRKRKEKADSCSNALKIKGAPSAKIVIEPKVASKQKENNVTDSGTKGKEPRLAHSYVATRADLNKCPGAPIPGLSPGGSNRGFGFWIGVWGCVPRTREEEPDSGVLRTGVPTRSKTEGCLRGTSGEPVSVQPCQGTSVMISSPWQETESRSSWCYRAKGEQRQDQNNEMRTRALQTQVQEPSNPAKVRPEYRRASRGHQGVMSIKESTGSTKGTPVAIQECSRLGMDIRSEYPPT